jgi:omega-6 fatty acid desaturase (delta-12 desaturase)
VACQLPTATSEVAEAVGPGEVLGVCGYHGNLGRVGIVVATMRQSKRLSMTQRSWREAVARYESPSRLRSLGQIANSLIPYLALLGTMYLSLRLSYWLTLALAVPAAGLLVRIFIILHDCGHGAFFASKRANRLVGFIAGLLTFIPSYAWSHDHAKHHASAGDLDNRGNGDIWTLTVREYLARSRWHRLWYRLYRHPVVMFGIGPLYTFAIRYRFWRRRDTSRARWNVIGTNAALLGIVLAMFLTVGLKAYLMVQGPIMALAAAVGVWLFYVQHQFEGTYWERHDKWSFVRAALDGASFYKLPRLLQWFTGNIGFHHVHHLSPRIPNYSLQKCHESHTLFQTIKPITLRESLRSLSYRLWDEEDKRLVGYPDL